MSRHGVLEYRQGLKLGLGARFSLRGRCGDDIERFMNLAPSPFTDLPLVIRALRGCIGGWGVRGVLSAALVLLLYRRVGEICTRLERLIARFQAGIVWRRPGRAPRERDGGAQDGGAQDGGAGSGVAGSARLWPLGFAWLVRAAGYQAAGFGSQLHAVLTQPDMVALLEAVPQAGRVLRPLCRMLGVEAAVLRAPVRKVVGSAASVEAGSRGASARPVPRKAREWGRIRLPRGVLAAARRDGCKA